MSDTLGQLDFFSVLNDQKKKKKNTIQIILSKTGDSLSITAWSF